MIRVAAVGDVHFDEDSRGSFRPHLEDLAERADLFLIAGDLTRSGDPSEAEVLADELRDAPVPTFAILGNHDYHREAENEIARALEDAGVRVLERSAATLEAGGTRVAVVGAKGFGGGFAGACGTDFGEPEMKAFIGHTKAIAAELEEVLRRADGEVKVVLLHYAPVKGTLLGERLEIYPFLGSYLLGEAVDIAGADLVVHGHAHGGTEKGITPGGIHVRNVALPVIKHAYNLYTLERSEASLSASVLS